MSIGSMIKCLLIAMSFTALIADNAVFTTIIITAWMLKLVVKVLGYVAEGEYQ